MNKKTKIDYINEIADKFINAKNHGSNGSNWWYPKSFTIAYNVKLHCNSKSIEDLREKMTSRQNDYYNKDERLYEIMQDAQEYSATSFSDDLGETYGVKSGYAGRSGGWLEVEYNSNGVDFADNDMSMSELSNLYSNAKELDAIETKVAQHIEKSHSNYCKYINTDNYIDDILSQIYSDEDIADM